MPEIVINETEIIYKSSSPQLVGQNGQISVGRQNAGKRIIAYVVEAK